MTDEKKLTYAGVGVDYASMDPFKRKAQMAARQTSRHLKVRGLREIEASRGESAYLVEVGDAYLAHVEEGLGTKNLVADAMYALTGLTYYDSIAQDTVAMIVNDMITVGARPISVAMHLAVGSSDWFDDTVRSDDLIRGWKDACDLSMCAWGGGETPTLKDIIIPGTVVLSGSAMGEVCPKVDLIVDNIQLGDAIVMFDSSGIHANGLTLARRIAAGLPHGYLTPLSDGRLYGEALLDPTHIYVPFIIACLRYGMKIHYAANITGHGWRKLMRSPRPFSYVIEALPPQLPIFDFIQAQGPVDDVEAYGNLNMGAGFAIFVPQDQLVLVERVAKQFGPFPYQAHVLGHVEESSEKKVIIKPKGIEFAGSTLAVR